MKTPTFEKENLKESFLNFEDVEEPQKCKDLLNNENVKLVETIKMWETISSSRLNSSDQRKNKYIVKVFIGGTGGMQVDTFQQTLHRVIHEFSSSENNPGLLEIEVEYISNDTVSVRKWLPKNLIDYLLKSDLHFILTHIHQGLTAKNIGWLIQPLLDNLERLKYHPGFPNGKYLECPVFLQDKVKYINAISSGIPTFSIKIVGPGDTFPAEDIFNLIDWCKSYEDRYTHGWVVKAPFTTNSHFVKFPKSIDKVVHIIQEANNNITVGFNQIPYLMVQPCLFNRKEYKVVFLDQLPIYISSLSNNNKRCSDGICKAFGDKSELISFCSKQVNELKTNIPGSITDGLFRVDVLQDDNGKMVVNEFESLEARYYGSINNEHHVHDFLFKYWYHKVSDLFKLNFTAASKARGLFFDELKASNNFCIADILIEEHEEAADDSF